MLVLQCLRDLMHGRNVGLLDQHSTRIKLIIEREESLPGNFVYPGINTAARIEVNGERIGEIDYGINPLGDRLYINLIAIRAGSRFRGYALGTLWLLWLRHQLPMVPLHQRGASTAFWVKARKRFARSGAIIEPELWPFELQLAQERWAHLVPGLPVDLQWSAAQPARK